MKRLLGALAFLLIATPAWASYPIVRDAAIYATSVSSGATHAIPNPVTSEVGDLVIVFLSCDGNTTVTWPSSSYLVGNAWTAIQNDTTDADSAHMSSIRYGILDAAMSGTENITASANEACSMGVVVIMVDTFTGTPTANSSAASSPVGAPNNAPDPASLTSGFGAVPTLWIMTASNDGSLIMRPSAPQTDFNYTRWVMANVSNSNAVSIAMAFKKESAASLDIPTGIMTVSGATEQWLANTIAVQGATPAGCAPSSDAACVIGSHLWSTGTLVGMWLAGLGLYVWRRRWA